MTRTAPSQVRGPTWLVDTDSGCTLKLYVQPRASKTELAGQYGECLKLRVAAPPVDGKANRQIAGFLADLLGCARSRITIESGRNSRTKLVYVPVDRDTVVGRLV